MFEVREGEPSSVIGTIESFLQVYYCVFSWPGAPGVTPMIRSDHEKMSFLADYII